MKTKGFTLVELLVVIAILAILATVSVVGYTSFIGNAEATAAEAELNSAHDAVLAAVTLDKSAILTLSDNSKVVCTRNANGGFTVAAYVEADHKNIDAVVDGIEDELLAKLKLDGTTLVYQYDSSAAKYNVATLAEITASAE